MHTSYKLSYQNYKFATTYPLCTNIALNKYGILVYVVDYTIYALSIVDIQNSEISFLYNYANYKNYNYGYFLMVLMKILSYDSHISYFDLDVIASNYLAISLYVWLGYLVVIQRIIISGQPSLSLQNVKVSSRNFWRRCLLLKYLPL